MLCPDTNCWIAYFAGEIGRDMAVLDHALLTNSVVLAPVILSEILSAPALPAEFEQLLESVPLLPVSGGYWHRAGHLRASMHRRDHRPKLADTLIAQSCLDHRTPLLTRDRDFSGFVAHAGLLLA